MFDDFFFFFFARYSMCLFLVDSINVTTPGFPESVKDGTIRFLKKVGDQVKADETIAEIETDKTNLSVNSPSAGVVEALLVADGDNVTSGAQVAKINTSGGGAAAAKQAPGLFRSILIIEMISLQPKKKGNQPRTKSTQKRRKKNQRRNPPIAVDQLQPKHPLFHQPRKNLNVKHQPRKSRLLQLDNHKHLNPHRV